MLKNTSDARVEETHHQINRDDPRKKNPFIYPLLIFMVIWMLYFLAPKPALCLPKKEKEITHCKKKFLSNMCSDKKPEKEINYFKLSN